MKPYLHTYLVVIPVILFLGASNVYAHEDPLPHSDTEEITSAAIKTSPISELFRNIFQKNIEQKRENLEKNKDIRNKLIEDRLNQVNNVFVEKDDLNIKFNQKKEGLNETTEEALIVSFIDNIDKLDNIIERIESRVKKFEEGEISVTEAKDLTLLATGELESAKILIYDIASTSTEVLATSSDTTLSKNEILSEAVENIKKARELLIDAITSLSLQIKTEVTSSSTIPASDKIQTTNNLE